MKRDQRRMKALFSIALLLLFLAPSLAAEVTYKDYTETRSQRWKRGFVFAIAHYLMTVAQPGEEAPYPMRTAYQLCLTNVPDDLLVQHVEAYVEKNPVNSDEPMVGIIRRTLSDLCRSEIEKTK